MGAADNMRRDSLQLLPRAPSRADPAPAPRGPVGPTHPHCPLDSLRGRFHITELLPRYRTHCLRGRDTTLPHLTPIEVHEVVDADQADRHAPTTHRARLIAWRLVITHEHLRGPAAARLAWGDVSNSDSPLKRSTRFVRLITTVHPGAVGSGLPAPTGQRRPDRLPFPASPTASR
jgi:hypothetical protein